MRNERGQFIVEAVLLITLFVGITLFVSQQFTQNNYLSTIVSSPWKSLSGLLQNGEWMPVQASMSLHPNNHIRHTSLLGDEVK